MMLIWLEEQAIPKLCLNNHSLTSQSFQRKHMHKDKQNKITILPRSKMVCTCQLRTEVNEGELLGGTVLRVQWKSSEAQGMSSGSHARGRISAVLVFFCLCPV